MSWTVKYSSWIEVKLAAAAFGIPRLFMSVSAEYSIIRLGGQLVQISSAHTLLLRLLPEHPSLITSGDRIFQTGNTVSVWHLDSYDGLNQSKYTYLV